LNPYRYALNNPIKLVDPLGLYESLSHYIVGRDAAVLAGLPRSLAEIVGQASGGVDTLHDPMKYKNRAFHFSNYKQADARLISASTLFELGEAVHTLMDTYTH